MINLITRYKAHPMQGGVNNGQRPHEILRSLKDQLDPYSEDKKVIRTHPDVMLMSNQDFDAIVTSFGKIFANFNQLHRDQRIEAIWLYMSFSFHVRDWAGSTAGVNDGPHKLAQVQRMDAIALPKINEGINAIGELWQRDPEAYGKFNLGFHQKMLQVNGNLFAFVQNVLADPPINLNKGDYNSKEFEKKAPHLPFSIPDGALTISKEKCKEREKQLNRETSSSEYGVNYNLLQGLQNAPPLFQPIKKNAGEMYIDFETGLELDFPLNGKISIETDGPHHLVQDSGKHTMQHNMKSLCMHEQGWSRAEVYSGQPPEKAVAIPTLLKLSVVEKYQNEYQQLLNFRQELRQRIYATKVTLANCPPDEKTAYSTHLANLLKMDMKIGQLVQPRFLSTMLTHVDEQKLQQLHQCNNSVLGNNLRIKKKEEELEPLFRSKRNYEAELNQIQTKLKETSEKITALEQKKARLFEQYKANGYAGKTDETKNQQKQNEDAHEAYMSEYKKYAAIEKLYNELQGTINELTHEHSDDENEEQRKQKLSEYRKLEQAYFAKMQEHAEKIDLNAQGHLLYQDASEKINKIEIAKKEIKSVEDKIKQESSIITKLKKKEKEAASFINFENSKIKEQQKIITDAEKDSQMEFTKVQNLLPISVITSHTVEGNQTLSKHEATLQENLQGIALQRKEDITFQMEAERQFQEEMALQTEEERQPQNERGKKDRDRRETDRKETGRRETDRKEIGRRETGRSDRDRRDRDPKGRDPRDRDPRDRDLRDRDPRDRDPRGRDLRDRDPRDRDPRGRDGRDDRPSKGRIEDDKNEKKEQYTGERRQERDNKQIDGERSPKRNRPNTSPPTQPEHLFTPMFLSQSPQHSPFNVTHNSEQQLTQDQTKKQNQTKEQKNKPKS